MAITARQQLEAYLSETSDIGDRFGEKAAEFALLAMNFFSEYIAQDSLDAGCDDDGMPMMAAAAFPTEDFQEVLKAFDYAEGGSEDLRSLRTLDKGE